MKLDRNMPENHGRGKYALVLLRNIDAPRSTSVEAAYPRRIREALRLLEEVGILDYGDTPETDFFVMRLKDQFAAPGLRGYADAANKLDVEYAGEIYELAARSENNPCRKLPD